MNKLAVVVILLLTCLYASGQSVPAEFIRGVHALDLDKNTAKQCFLKTIHNDSAFSGAYQLLGLIYFQENQSDSAILYFNQALALNKENTNHIRETIYIRLIDSYCYKHDLKKAFDTAIEAHRQYPNNQLIAINLRDICLWSVYSSQNGLPVSYLSVAPQDEYVVKSISEEYLILRWIRIHDRSLIFNHQAMVVEDNVNYDVLNCIVSETTDSLTLKFRLDWDLSRHFEGIVPDTDQIYADKSLPVYERLGALFIKNPSANIDQELDLLQNAN